MPSEVETGKVARLVPDRGFGFIQPDDGTPSIFFHCYQLVGVEFEQLAPNARVTFVRGSDATGRPVCAVVRLAEGSAA